MKSQEDEIAEDLQRCNVSYRRYKYSTETEKIKHSFEAMVAFTEAAHIDWRLSSQNEVFHASSHSGYWHAVLTKLRNQADAFPSGKFTFIPVFSEEIFEIDASEVSKDFSALLDLQPVWVAELKERWVLDWRSSFEVVCGYWPD